MRYIVDPYLVVDVLDGDPEWGERSARLLDAHRQDALVLTSLGYLALAPAFCGRRQLQDEFLQALGISVAPDLPKDSLDAAYDAWSSYRRENPDDVGRWSPFDAFCIGVAALDRDGILTRRGELYRRYLRPCQVLEP